MPMFKLRINENNRKIADFLEAAERGVEVLQDGKNILVKFKYGLHISRLEIGSIIREFTDNDWRSLIKEIKNTLTGAKLQMVSDVSIGMRPLRTEDVHIRLDPLERETIEEAAVMEGRSLSDFIRSAALKRASEVFDREKARRMAERKRREESHMYVS